MVVARRYLVRGRVHGVGFRAFAEHAAHREGLTGFVRNLADGRVEAVAEGDRSALDRFERALRGGPMLARVDALAIDDVAPPGGTTGFRILEDR